MQMKYWSTLFVVGSLGMAGMARGQAAPEGADLVPPVAEEPPEALVQSLPPEPPAAPEAPQWARPPAPDWQPGPAGGQERMPVVTARRPRGATWIGVEVSLVPPALASQLRLEPGTGVVVENVFPRSPAQRAGVQQYDVIFKVNNQVIGSPQQLQGLIRHAAGEVTLTLIREYQSMDVRLKPSYAPGSGGGDYRPAPQMAPGGPYPPYAPGMPHMPGAMPVPTPRPEQPYDFGTSRPPMPPAPFQGEPVAPGAPPGYAGPHTSGTAITLQFENGQLMATITRDGRIQFKGSIDVLEFRKDLPRDARRIIERLRAAGAAPREDTTPARPRFFRSDSDGEDNDPRRR